MVVVFSTWQMTRHGHFDRYPAPLVLRVLVLLLTAAVPAKAYMDPGSGQLIWQVAGAFFLGCLYQVRKLLIRFRKGK
jgi:hypothetical protein